MLSRCSVIVRRGFSKDLLVSRWKRSDPNRYWRAQHKLPADDDQHGPLADLPDYSYLNGESSHLSTAQRKRYDFNESVVRRIHELDAELAHAKEIYQKKIESTLSDYKKTVDIAQRIKASPSSKISKTSLTDKVVKPSISYPHEYSLQPQLLNALRDAKTYNEAYAEAIDPVGAIVPDKLLPIDSPPHKHVGERRRYHKVFTLRTPKRRMFPR